ncbi:putative DNA binding domain-containing protein [Bifidobacterium pullorum subsp. saeculare]|uniref:RNA-binding domain-containing protein n=1 Tax=Bifidobacterium pullorum TaxID=78448 RepID=UPI001956C083|nr:RNA-binding domain-containing protein [Bifidobacterium pullorum]MBM6691708.1 putative DNA binding domain-containing protein [Bifidobacterium pullorum subsp. saeculare]
MSDALDRYIQAGEGISVEFKRCGSQPGQDTFETICSFANRQGGSILLGVRDDGAVEGVSEASALNIERNISNVTSDPNLFNVSPLVEFERLHDTEGRLVIRVWVPMGPSLYAFKGAVFDRVADADVRVRSDVQITSMMARKQSYYSERTVYPWVTEDDLEMDLLGAVRDALRANDADHPWLSLSDGELLRAARLYGRDQLTGERGFNLAAVALLGKEGTILDVMPLYRTDAVLRRVETDRYDDRLVCRSNLVRAYDELVGFCEKWLPDSFVLDGGQRKSARDVIVRELVCNCLIHREFVSPHIARITIDGEGIRTSNASRALFAGPVTLESLDPTPKNPIIANFFTQMGRSEELGSGTKSLYKFSRLYTGKDPVLEDGDRFTAFVPVPPVMADAAGSKDDHDAATGAEGNGAVGGSRGNRTRAEVERVADDLLARSGSFAATEVSERITRVGERTVRRYLADMVREGKLVSDPRGRSTTYRAGNSADGLNGDR